jgi:predicted short-subunit dehydrogenase-like oxidoreductase (DUF2520 family)
VHTSGSVPLETLSGISSNIGVFYPVQTLSFGKKVDFRHVPVCLEANDEENFSRLESLAQKISGKTYRLDSHQRSVLHMAAVFACNFTFHMYTLAADILKAEDIEPGILHSLIEETANKAVNVKPGTGQTGPAAREDMKVIEKHLELLKDNQQYADIYKLITDSIIRYKKKT